MAAPGADLSFYGVPRDADWTLVILDPMLPVGSALGFSHVQPEHAQRSIENGASIVHRLQDKRSSGVRARWTHLTQEDHDRRERAAREADATEYREDCVDLMHALAAPHAATIEHKRPLANQSEPR